MSSLEYFDYTYLSTSEQKFKTQAASIFNRLSRLNRSGFNVMIEDNLYRVKIFSISDPSSKDPTGVLLTFFSADKWGQAPQFTSSEAKRLLTSATQQCPLKLKSKTREIIKLTAMGLRAQEIADALNLSSRGVDYHLDIAKKNFGAANKANLIFLATKAGWI
ncbi:helix-turn-helix transcriptional regulator [Ferrimonas kyonanensis]|uniref:helix-turn-helix transcriptional regulator n=1 Tax=Ferrimonas kyonanensis TaxID=364763 RepID=UPI00146D30E9|nr:LuxR C-terminal-related transcriptional regulator [Ferrimonas kyonanensis]